ncbi:hypothetical protein CWO90_37235 [Bradyrhizobium sp. Leo121]|nr:hypothetical protein CWO90_37235 [Bradyrhizobium sp. Leo121]
MELLVGCKMTELSWLATPHFVVATSSIPPDHDHESAVCRRGNDVNAAVPVAAMEMVQAVSRAACQRK